MAANVMEILKQIQHDLLYQKEFMQIKFKLLEEKIEKQQYTIEKLEHEIKKSNVVLFGNEEIEADDKNTMFDKLDVGNKEIEDQSVEQSEKPIDNSEAEQLHSALKVTEGDEKECNYKDENDKDTDIKCNEHSNTVKVTEEDKKESSYESDIFTNNKKEINHIEFLANEMKDIKDMIKDYIASRNATVEAVSPMNKQETATRTILSPDRIMKFHKEVEDVENNLINVIPTIQHFMWLCKGVEFAAYDKSIKPYRIKLGMTGFKRSEVINLLTEYPNFNLCDIVKEGLSSTNQWKDLFKIYNFNTIHKYDY